MSIDSKTRDNSGVRFIGERGVALLKEPGSGIRRLRSINITPLRGGSKLSNKMRRCAWQALVLPLILLMGLNFSSIAQNPVPNSETLKKANARPTESTQPKPEPF